MLLAICHLLGNIHRGGHSPALLPSPALSSPSSPSATHLVESGSSIRLSRLYTEQARCVGWLHTMNLLTELYRARPTQGYRVDDKGYRVDVKDYSVECNTR
eukprot:1203311-Pyramimonas_sp.AAC.1